MTPASNGNDRQAANHPAVPEGCQANVVEILSPATRESITDAITDAINAAHEDWHQKRRERIIAEYAAAQTEWKAFLDALKVNTPAPSLQTPAGKEAGAEIDWQQRYHSACVELWEAREALENIRRLAGDAWMKCSVMNPMLGPIGRIQQEADAALSKVSPPAEHSGAIGACVPTFGNGSTA